MKKKKVLITGASRGIGRAIKERLEYDYELVLHARNEDSFDYNIDNFSVLFADFSDSVQVDSFCKQLKREHGDDLFAVINNAGLAIDNSIFFLPEKDIDKMIQVNLKAPILIAKQAVKIFHNRKEGVLINMSSIVGQTGNAYQGVYAACKAGLITFSKSLVLELGQLNESHEVRINCIAPGLIESDMSSRIPSDQMSRIIQQIPLHRIGKATEVANLVSFLLSDEAKYINGSNVQINGGLI